MFCSPMRLMLTSYAAETRSLFLAPIPQIDRIRCERGRGRGHLQPTDSQVLMSASPQKESSVLAHQDFSKYSNRESRLEIICLLSIVREHGDISRFVVTNRGSSSHLSEILTGQPLFFLMESYTFGDYYHLAKTSVLFPWSVQHPILSTCFFG